MLNLPPPVEGRIVFVDTEFTTLDRQLREVWETALIIRDPGEPDVEVEWQLRPDLTYASGDSLRIGRYYRRNRVQDKPVGTGVVIVGPGFSELDFRDEVDEERLTDAATIAGQVAWSLENAFIVGAVVSADELTIDRFLRQQGQILAHHYRIRCIEAMAHGYLLGRNRERELDEARHFDMIEIPPPPWDTKQLFRAAGVEPPENRLAHRALVDARGVRAVWDEMHGNTKTDD